ncbi:MAG TPA: hypothetical protein PKC39_02785 [Ferruginibacter sp.]|nr:hypothetical protein [Ferruginibacter sp.]HMP19863.1 hypothetical protein [Ferruginibacter sp.]
MNWLPVKTQSALLNEYRLMQNNGCKVILKYNPQHRSARLISEDNLHSLFYLETPAQHASRVIITDQYGMNRGYIALDKIHAYSGTASLEGKKYHFRIQHYSSPVLIIYENSPSHPLLSSTFEVSGEAGLTNSLLLGLCWYALQQQKVGVMEFAA